MVQKFLKIVSSGYLIHSGKKSYFAGILINVLNMKKSLLCFAMLLQTSYLSAQQVLFAENFNSGNTSFVLNTADVGSTTAGYNFWTINNSYSGGNGSVICFGMPFSFTVPATATQPAAIAGGPNSHYMHIVSDAGIANGVSNCCFLAADGLCNNAEQYFAAMNNDLSTTGYDTVSLSFWWLCQGGNNSFGEVYYSLDGGNTWSKITSPIANYNNTGNWTQQIITLPQFSNQSTLRFGFRFVNQVAIAASDPGFGIDDIVVTAVQNVVIPVVNFTSNIQSFCEESCVQFTDLSVNNPVSWQWYFPGGIPDTSTLQNPVSCYKDPGNYDVTLIACNSNGCDSITIPGYIEVYPNPPKPVVTIHGDTLCATFSAGYSYQWFYNITNLIPGATNYCYIAVFPGSYFVQISDTSGCINTSDTIVITGVQENLLIANSFQVINNPSYQQIEVSIAGNVGAGTELEVRSMDGRKVFSTEVKFAGKLKVEHLATGIYSVMLRNKQLKASKRAVVF